MVIRLEYTLFEFELFLPHSQIRLLFNLKLKDDGGGGGGGEVK